MKKLLFIIVFVSLFFINDIVFAKRTLPQARPVTGTKAVTSNSRGITALVKFRADRRAIVVTFSNLAVASKVDYMLSYSTRGTTQGASGSINLAQGDTIRELLFGTCSHGVCRYDTGITNAKLTVTTTLATGRKVIKTFRLKV